MLSLVVVSVVATLPSTLVAAEERLVPLQPFRGVSICAPISVRIVDAMNSSATTDFSARLVGERAAIDAVSLTTTGGSLSVQVREDRDLDTGADFLELEVSLPAGTMQYVERVHAPGDTVILSEFDREKAEVASSGAGSIWIPFLKKSSNSKKSEKASPPPPPPPPPRLSMAKISLSAPGTVLASGDAGFWELFTADEKAEVRIDGVAVGENGNENGASPYSTVSVRLDAGRAIVNPAPSKLSHVSITGFALAPARAKAAVLEYSGGQCSARKEVFGGKSSTDGGDETSPLDGSACDRIAPLPIPAPAPPSLSWSCGIRTTGSWTCGGPGLSKGRKPGSVVVTGCAASREQVEAIAKV